MNSIYSGSFCVGKYWIAIYYRIIQIEEKVLKEIPDLQGN